MDGFGIRIEGLSKRYGEGDTAVDALKDVNMTVAPGEVVGLIGPSGSGKSTAVRALIRQFILDTPCQHIEFGLRANALEAVPVVPHGRAFQLPHNVFGREDRRCIGIARREGREDVREDFFDAAHPLRGVGLEEERGGEVASAVEEAGEALGCLFRRLADGLARDPLDRREDALNALLGRDLALLDHLEDA